MNSNENTNTGQTDCCVKTKVITPINQDQIPIMVLWGLDENTIRNPVDEETFERFHNCGFNLVRVNIAILQLEKSAANAYKHGLGIVLSDGSINKTPSYRPDKPEDIYTQEIYSNEVSAILNSIHCVNKTYEGFVAGLWLKDEPTFRDLTYKYKPGDKDYDYRFLSLCNKVNTIREIETKWDCDQRLPLMINLFPLAVSNKNLYDENVEEDLRIGPLIDINVAKEKRTIWRYNRYLDAFSTYCCSTWSYDMYPIIGRRDGNSIFVEKDEKGGIWHLSAEHEVFYENLKLVHEKSLRNGDVFWAFCECQSFILGRIYYPKAKPGYFRFEAYSALAMGAKGIAYYSYATDDGDDSFSALIDKNGATTAAYEYAGEVNKEIQNFSHVFLHSILVDYAHFGEIYPGCKEMRVPIGFLKKAEVVSTNDEPQNRGALVSLLKTGCGLETEYYVVVVSHDPFQEQEVKLYFEEGSVIENLTYDTYKGVYRDKEIIGSKDGVKLLMRPGDCLIFKKKNLNTK